MMMIYCCWLYVVLALVTVTAGAPVTEYGVILDAGSSSTKIRIYSWTETIDGVPTFTQSFYHKVSPGISAFNDNIDGIETYIRTILDVVKLELAAPSVWPLTPIYFFPTAGLRLLEMDMTKIILATVRNVLSDNDVNPFLFDNENGHILTGEEEALFAWLTINYLQSTFQHNRGSSDSHGILELGGGSAQIAFIPDEPVYAGKQTTTIAGREYGVYCHSHLSFGSSMFNEKIIEYLVDMNPNAQTIFHPCMLAEDVYNTTIAGRALGLVGGGNASLCESIIRHFLSPATDDKCSPKPCSIGEVYQPRISQSKFLTFGLIYKLAKTFGALDGAGTLNLEALQHQARMYCAMTLLKVTEELGMPAKYASRNCQDGLYIPLLFNALGFPLGTQNILAIEEINGNSLAWSLGAMLYEEERARYQDFTLRHFGLDTSG